MTRLPACLLLLIARTGAADGSGRAWELTQLAEAEARAGNCARVAELRSQVVELDPGMAADVFDRDVAIAQCEARVPALKAAVAEKGAKPTDAFPKCDEQTFYVEPYFWGGFAGGSTTAIRTSVGMGYGGCDVDGGRGWQLRAGAFAEAADRTFPRDYHTGEANFGGEAEIGVRIPGYGFRVGPRIALGWAANGERNGSLLVTNGVRVRGDNLSFGVDVVHATATAQDPAFTQVAVGIGVSTSSTKGVLITLAVLGGIGLLGAAAAGGGN